MIGVYTHAFDYYYKVAPTASGAIMTSDWFTKTHFVDNDENNSEYIRNWYNLFASSTYFPSYPGIITRKTPQTSGSVVNNGALAWGSAASDFLWNVLTPSLSISQSQVTPDEYGLTHDTYYRFTYNSESLFYNEFSVAGITGSGIRSYPLTSSWIAYEPRMIQYASGSTSIGYTVRGTTDSNHFPATIQNPNNTTYSLPYSASTPTNTYPLVGKNPPNVFYGDNSTGSNDGRFFDLAGGVGITRSSVSASLVAFNKSSSFTTLSAKNFCTGELKKRRLFFPTIRTGSMALAPNSPGIWVQTMLEKPSADFFTENGGIYNIKFTIKRDITNQYYPDAAGGSDLLVYIHNINTTIPNPTQRVGGADGWYPPEANIVRIKNTPAMTFSNPSTGYLIETFNINVVQYGTPAQLVFEASGSLANDSYFGCIIDDVEFCKVGVTTDPTLIKPTTTGGLLEQQEKQKHPVEETPVEETPAEEVPVEEVPVEETPAEEVPAEEVPVEEVPVEETPAEEVPVEETPADPVEETPAEEAYEDPK